MKYTVLPHRGMKALALLVYLFSGASGGVLVLPDAYDTLTYRIEVNSGHTSPDYGDLKYTTGWAAKKGPDWTTFNKPIMKGPASFMAAPPELAQFSGVDDGIDQEPREEVVPPETYETSKGGLQVTTDYETSDYEYEGEPKYATGRAGRSDVANGPTLIAATISKEPTPFEPALKKEEGYDEEPIGSWKESPLPDDVSDGLLDVTKDYNSSDYDYEDDDLKFTGGRTERSEVEIEPDWTTFNTPVSINASAPQSAQFRKLSKEAEELIEPREELDPLDSYDTAKDGLRVTTDYETSDYDYEDEPKHTTRRTKRSEAETVADWTSFVLPLILEEPTAFKARSADPTKFPEEYGSEADQGVWALVSCLADSDPLLSVLGLLVTAFFLGSLVRSWSRPRRRPRCYGFHLLDVGGRQVSPDYGDLERDVYSYCTHCRNYRSTKLSAMDLTVV